MCDEHALPRPHRLLLSALLNTVSVYLSRSLSLTNTHTHTHTHTLSLPISLSLPLSLTLSLSHTHTHTHTHTLRTHLLGAGLISKVVSWEADKV